MRRLVALTVAVFIGSPEVFGACVDPNAEEGRFQVRGVEMTDKRSGLIWLRCPAGYVAPSGTCDSSRVLPSTTWEGAMRPPMKTAQMPPGNWRLASIEELESIAAKGCGHAFNAKNIEILFDEVWSSSSAGDDMVWLLDKNGGRVKSSKTPKEADGGDFFAQTIYVRNAEPTQSTRPAAAVDADAKAIVDRFIGAMKMASEVPGAHQTLRQLGWVDIRVTELIGETTIHEEMFDTDLQGIKGYKRLIETRVRSQGSAEGSARYVLIAYKDRTSGIWKVFDIRDLKGSNSTHEIEAAAHDLDSVTSVKRQMKYRRYAYWLAFDGKVGMAKQAYDRAIELNNADPDEAWAKFETGRFQALQAITGQ